MYTITFRMNVFAISANLKNELANKVPRTTILKDKTVLSHILKIGSIFQTFRTVFHVTQLFGKFVKTGTKVFFNDNYWE